MQPPTLAGKTLPIIFSDLDGTLLDHDDYSFDAALPALKKAQQAHIPLIANTSKTAAEVIELQSKIPQMGAFIVENGSGIGLVKGSTLTNYLLENPAPDSVEYSGLEEHEHWFSIPFEQSHKENVRLLKQLQDSYHYLLFSQLSVEQAQELTGLPAELVKKALQRNFTDPIVWQDSTEAKNAFVTELENLGLSVLQGGRFMHLRSNCDKGKAMKWVVKQLSQRLNRPVTSIALGDGGNDIPMLEQADIAILIKSQQPPNIQRKDVIRTIDAGPSGWNHAILDVLATLD